MMSSFSLSSSSSSSSSISTTIKVDKATSELLAAPDWTMNIQICDLCNSNHWMAKEIVKGVKRRLKHKNPRVVLLTLTLMETMVKNCGEYIHYQIAERKILDEMVKIVKKKGDMHVRDNILMLLSSWQEAFGGPGGKYSQYYWACDELRRFGAQFPQRSQRSAPVITPPVMDQPKVPQIGYDMPSDHARRLDGAMTSEVEGLSFSTLKSMRNTFEILNDMLKALKPMDRMAAKDEVIIDLVDRCRANQKKLVQMITTTTDEDLLGQGLEMYDSLQSVLAKHVALASGTPLSDRGRSSSSTQQSEVELNTKPNETGEKHSAPNYDSLVSPTSVSKDHVEQEEEEEEDFKLLSRRHSKAQSGPSQQSGSSGVTEDGPSSSGSNNALALIDAPALATDPPTTTNVSEDQNLIDLLSLVLTTTSPSETPEAPISGPLQTTFETSCNSYVVPWAQSPQQQQPQAQTQSMMPPLQNQYQHGQPHAQMHPQTQHGYSQYASSYSAPPPWEVSAGYGNYQNPGLAYMYPNYQGNMNNGPYSTQNNVNDFHYSQYGNQPMYSTTQNSTNLFPTQTNMSPHQLNSFQNMASSINDNNASSISITNSFPSKASNPSILNGSTLVTNGTTSISSGQTPFVPSYKLFEDLNVLGSSEARHKNGPYPSASSGNIYQNMVTGRR